MHVFAGEVVKETNEENDAKLVGGGDDIYENINCERYKFVDLNPTIGCPCGCCKLYIVLQLVCVHCCPKTRN